MDYGHMWWATIKPNQKSNLSLFILNNHKKRRFVCNFDRKVIWIRGKNDKILHKFAISIYPW